jgi:hypothetical protein
MAQFAVPKHLRADHSIILVGQDEQDRWIVEENHGFVMAAFRHKADAVRFANHARRRFRDAIVLVTQARIQARPQHAA